MHMMSHSRPARTRSISSRTLRGELFFAPAGCPDKMQAMEVIELKWRRALVAAALLACATPVCAQPSPGGNYPSRPIRFIAPFIAGAGTDITARTVAQKLGEELGQTVVVDNRPGAAGNIGMELAAKSPPDGNTIVLVSATHTVNPALHKKLAYDLVRDFAPVSQVTSQPYCLTVNPGVPAKTVRELIDLIRARPNFYTYGSSGTGGLSHLAGTLFGSMAKVQWIHVPYKGGAAGIIDMLGGQIHSQFATIIGTVQHVKAGKLRWLAVSTAKRSQAAPDLPTISEAALPGYEISGWYGILAPAQTPRAIVTLLNAKIVAALKSPEVGPKFAIDGSEPVGSSPGDFAAHIKAAIVKHASLVKESGMREE
jgi:tripartite-type tricarboxylate transporter receptor subunit TctC